MAHTIKYDDVTPMLDDNTDEEILAHFQGQGDRTYRSVPLGTFFELGRVQGFLIKTAESIPVPGATDGETEQTVKWEGRFMAMYFWVRRGERPDAISEAMWLALREGITRFFSHVTDSRTNIFDLTDPEFFAEFMALRTIFPPLPAHPTYGQCMTTEDFDSVLNAAGGVVNSDLTLAEIQQWRAQWIETEERQARTDAHQAALQPFRDAIAAREALIQAELKVLKDNLDNALNSLAVPDDMPLADFQALALQVQNSPNGLIN